MEIIDLRSDTVTKPTPQMRKAMAEAEVGDDVLGEDPTARKLERLAAEIIGKEAALFVPSGTMGNLIAVCCHITPGEAVLAEQNSHCIRLESGGIAAIAGAVLHTVPARDDGCLHPDDIAPWISPPSMHRPRPRLLILENTHNLAGGVVTTPERTRQLADLVHAHDMRLHIDGARIFNSAIAQGVDAKQLAAPADSIMFCLSKSLGAPVGSILAGPAEFIERARHRRKMLGGGMRQVGILAAAGIVALTEHIARLAEDHEKARRLAELIADAPGIEVNLARVQTNMVYFSVRGKLDAPQFVAALGERGVLCLPVDGRIRLVTHLDVTPEQTERAGKIIAQAARELL